MVISVSFRKDEEGKLKALFEDPESGIKSIHTGYLNAYDTVFCHDHT